MKLHVKIFAIASICSLGAGAVPAVGQTQTRPMPAVETGTVQDQLSGEELRQAEEDLAQGFETLFTEVVYETSDGRWGVNEVAAEEYGLSVEEAKRLASYMESGDFPETGDGHAGYATRDLESYASCVVSNILPIPVDPITLRDVGKLLRDKQWRAAAEKIIANAALDGAQGFLEFGIKGALSNPVFLAARLALYAGSCAVAEHL